MNLPKGVLTQMPSSDRDLSEPPAYIPPGTFLGLPATRQTTGVDLAIVGIPFSSGGAGSQHAPAAIRAASVGVRPTNPARRANILRYCRAIDYGDLTVVPGLIQETYHEIEAGLRPLVEAGVTPICMGGDHSVTLGQLRALRRRHGPLGFVLMDAHHDIYDSYYEGLVRYNAGTHLRRAINEGLVDPTRSIIAGLRTFRDVDDDPAALGLDVLTIDGIADAPIASTVERIRARLGDGPAFMSFDIDVMDPACAPGTGSPVPGGLTNREALAIVRGLANVPFVGFDIAEINPALDPSRITAGLGAYLMFEFMSLIAIRKSTD